MGEGVASDQNVSVVLHMLYVSGMRSRSVEVKTSLLTTVDREVGRALLVSKVSW